MTVETTASPFHADPEERLFKPHWTSALRDRNFALLLVLCFLIHAAAISALLLRDPDEPTNLVQPEEIPVEIVTEEPPPPPPPPLPPEVKQQKPPPQKQVEKKPEKLKDDDKPAFDAPREASDEKVERQALQPQTAAPAQAPTQQVAAPTPTQDKTAKLAPEDAPKLDELTATKEAPPDDKPDAEPLDKMTPLQQPKASERKQATRSPQQRPEDVKSAVARQLAALAPAPNFSLAARAKPSPITGGTEQTTYKSVLLGLIMRQQRDAPTAHVRHEDVAVLVGLWIDENGNLVHQVLYHTSGYPEIDQAAVAAVRKAAPFPPPPAGEPHGFVAQLVFKAK